MDTEQYFKSLGDGFDEAFSVAAAARAKGYDPEPAVEIKPAPDLAARVEALIGVDGLAELIRSRTEGKTSPELAFDIAKEVSTNAKFDTGDVAKRILLAIRCGLAVLTEGVVVAPTEGVQGVALHKNADGSTYAAILYAGPIRSAGGTAVALSIALGDYSRRALGIGPYKAQQGEIERYLEEIEIYDSRCARLQYYPPEEDIKLILQNCQICVDGLPTEQVEVSVHRNLKRLDANGKEEALTNRVRGGIGLVLCEGLAQKAKSVYKHTKNAGLDWSWLNGIIKAGKSTPDKKEEEHEKEAVFLRELIAGRPVLAYPEHSGSFRLRYGRSRLTGIAGKGFSPATMILVDEFIACGTQLKIEKPGKGCIAMPVDSIEGPFVKLDNGRALRINSADKALELKGRVRKVIAVGDVLVTYGDFKKTNTPLQPTSYVEEYWFEQLKAAGFSGEMPNVATFGEATSFSRKFGVPLHPLYLYEYQDINGEELMLLAKGIAAALNGAGGTLENLKELTVKKEPDDLTGLLETLCVPHVEGMDAITIKGSDAQSVVTSLGFAGADGTLKDVTEVLARYNPALPPLEMLNAVSPFRLARRSTHIGGRIGRPEKARERLMKPAINVLFPIGEYGGKERSISKAYSIEKRKFGNEGIDADIARMRCIEGKELVSESYCKLHKSRARVERVCKSCGRPAKQETCSFCGNATVSSERRRVDVVGMVESALAVTGVGTLPKILKGVKGLSNRDKIPEPLEKGVLRAVNGVYIFKDGTARFDATDAPITHFYPSEIGVSVERLKRLGYSEDYRGNPLTRDDQLVELRHQDVILARRGADYFVKVAKFVDALLVKFYKLKPYYNVNSMDDMIGHLVMTMSPHTSAGVLCRIVGFTDASIGLAHPYVISARRRNCDGDEDTTMLLLDALINFSRSYLPVTIGGTMDAPLVVTIKVEPESVDDEVHNMEVTESFGLEFYEKGFEYTPPGEVKVETVKNRLGTDTRYSNLAFTHVSGPDAITKSPGRSVYTKLKSMQEKVDLQFKLMDRLCSVEKSDTARKLIISHFIPDLIGNMHSFSRQNFRCVACNTKYRRAPLVGKCTRCGGKLVLTIAKGSIEKYMEMAINLADRYNLEPYIKQRLLLIKEEIANVFGGVGGGTIPVKQFNLAKFM